MNRIAIAAAWLLLAAGVPAAEVQILAQRGECGKARGLAAKYKESYR